MKKYNVAVVGATGLVGRMFLRVLEEYAFPVERLKLFASIKSKGKTVRFCNKEYVVEELNENSFAGIEIAFFSAGAKVSEKYVPIAAASGAVAVDNSSFWRMAECVPLIVPEINLYDYTGGRVIANPNCSTIQAVLPLFALKKFGLKSVNYVTCQAVSGSGQKGISDLNLTLNGSKPMFYPYDISKTCLPEIGDFLTDGYTGEERKMEEETRKILHMPALKVSATCIRVPVPNCHAVTIAAELETPFDLDEIRAALGNQRGIILQDCPAERLYPTACAANGTDSVYVGRLRRDKRSENGILMYSVADNVRKGAAANAVQIVGRLSAEGRI